MKVSRVFVYLGAFLVLFAASAIAQDTAQITGTVRDASGAVVPNAEVKVVSSAIGLTRAVTTNSDGNYLAGALPASTYDLSVTAPGFKAFKANRIVLQVAEKARVDVDLQVGQVTENVTVEGQNVAQVETETSDLSGVVTGKQISQLELNGRSFTKLVALVPGVSDQTGSDSGGVGLDANVSFSINGGRTEYNNWQVDGANNMDTGSNATLDVFPNEDSIAEFRVFTSNYSAAYGRNGSGNVEVVTKAGTKQFHGDVWEYLRNDLFNANDWFDNNAGNPRPAYKRHDFGFTVGGPVIFPGYNKNRDKTFFFYSENWRRERNPFSFNQQVPSVAERGGNFSDLCPGAECPIDPATGNPFPGNTVPIDPNAQVLVNALISAPNATIRPPGNPQGPLESFFVGSTVEPLTWRQDLVRIDHNFNEKFRLMSRYIHDSYNNVDPTVSFVGNPFPTVQTKIGTPGTSFVLHLTTSVSPTLLNEFIFSYSADHLLLTNTGNFKVPAGFTMTSLFATGPGGAGLAQLPAVSLASGNAYGGGFTINPGFMPWENANPTYGYHDTVTKIIGSHNLQFGGDFIAIQKNEPNAPTGVGLGGALTFDETNSFTDPITHKPLTTHNSFADFLTGHISSYAQTSAIVRYYYRYKIFEPYIQDDWHVSKKLTLNLGLRVSLFPTNRDISKTSFNFAPSAYSTAAIVPIDADGSVTGVAGSLIPGPNGNPFNGFVQCGGKGGNSQVPAPVLSLFPAASVAGTSQPGCQKGHYVNWGPRIGFAYDPKGDGKTAIRAGYGIFQEYTNGNEANAESLEGTPPRVLTASQPNIASGVSGCAAGTGYTCIGGGGALLPPLVNNFPPATIEGKIFWPYVQQWHLDVQRELPGHTLATLSYVGSKGTHLTNVRDLNQIHSLPPGQNPYGPGQPLTDSDCANGTANGVVPAPGSQLFANFNVACGGNADLFRPFASISALEFLETQANSNYHALQLSVRRTIGALQLSGAYTYSHSIDNSSDRGDTTFTDSYNLGGNKASSNFDQRHILNISYVYDLPFFRKSSGLTKTLLGGWQWSGIIKSQSGIPVNVDNTVFGDNAGTGNGVEGRSSVSRPDLAGDAHSAACTPTPGPGPLLFNPCAFTAPRGLTFGNTPRNFLNLPYRTNFDMGLYKQFAITESKAVEFRWETFNTFNHTQFSGIDADFGSSTFLTANTTHDPRIMQFALKFLF